MSNCPSRSRDFGKNALGWSLLDLQPTIGGLNVSMGKFHDIGAIGLKTKQLCSYKYLHNLIGLIQKLRRPKHSVRV